jgi:hypothetical protein
LFVIVNHFEPGIKGSYSVIMSNYDKIIAFDNEQRALQ